MLSGAKISGWCAGLLYTYFHDSWRSKTKMPRCGNFVSLLIAMGWVENVRGWGLDTISACPGLTRVFLRIRRESVERQTRRWPFSRGLKPDGHGGLAMPGKALDCRVRAYLRGKGKCGDSGLRCAGQNDVLFCGASVLRGLLSGVDDEGCCTEF